MKNRFIRLAVFASGKGSNFEALIHYFHGHPFISITLLVCNKAGAGVIDLAKKYNIKWVLREDISKDDGSVLMSELSKLEIDYLVLAGFLKKIPARLVENFPRRIINIHPALLPKFGGKGMYGANVHQAVIEAGEKESGITIHFVDEHYDTGDIIFQASCKIDAAETAESLAGKIHKLEHRHFPATVESVILSQNPG